MTQKSDKNVTKYGNFQHLTPSCLHSTMQTTLVISSPRQRLSQETFNTTNNNRQIYHLINLNLILLWYLYPAILDQNPTLLALWHQLPLHHCNPLPQYITHRLLRRPYQPRDILYLKAVAMTICHFLQLIGKGYRRHHFNLASAIPAWQPLRKVLMLR